MRSIRRIALLLVVLTAAMVLQTAGASSASAATTCKTYDGWLHTNGTTLRNQRVCAAPGRDFPNYTGWGRVVDTYSTSPGICGFSVFPYDIDDPQPAIACAAVMPAPLATWAWSGQKWVPGVGLYPGQMAYFAPFGNGWRWAWTKDTGWVAIQESHVAFRWLA